MARPCAATGFTPDAGRKPEHKSSVAARKIHPAWACFRTGHGHGRPTGACSITARRVTPTASRGIQHGSKYGGTKPPENGPAMTYQISRLILIPTITWDLSS